MISRCVLRLSVLRNSFSRVAKRMLPFFSRQLNVMFSASGKAALWAHVLPLSSERKTLPSPKPKALLSRCESMYGPSGASRNKKCSFSRTAPSAACSRESPGQTLAAAVEATLVLMKWRRCSESCLFMGYGFRCLSKNANTTGRRSFCLGCKWKVCGRSFHNDELMLDAAALL